MVGEASLRRGSGPCPTGAQGGAVAWTALGRATPRARSQLPLTGGCSQLEANGQGSFWLTRPIEKGGSGKAARRSYDFGPRRRGVAKNGGVDDEMARQRDVVVGIGSGVSTNCLLILVLSLLELLVSAGQCATVSSARSCLMTCAGSTPRS